MHLSLQELSSTNSKALLSAAGSGSGYWSGTERYQHAGTLDPEPNAHQDGAGGTHQLIGKFTTQDVKVSTTAEDAITKYSLSDTSSGSSKEKTFCRTCGCTLWTIPAAAKGKFYMIRLPLLDGGLKFQPANEIFVRNRPTWVEPVKDAGQWEEMRK
ncbi:hypothetical protein H9L39_13980 [Fusarium oxysporum f. sp. albedinis]|nr:hypothetical protein H9L39_13980 [Fusarium oxysporum f. sp. albedinis]